MRLCTIGPAILAPGNVCAGVVMCLGIPMRVLEAGERVASCAADDANDR
jgi:hypothetical protein